MSDASFMEKLLEGVDVVWKPLENVCELITTGKLNANAMEVGGMYPFFTCNAKPYKINNYAFDLEAIIISGNGSQVGHLNYYKGKFNAKTPVSASSTPSLLSHHSRQDPHLHLYR